MASVSGLIAEAMTEAGVWSGQYDPATQWLKWFNEWYHDSRWSLSLYLNENFNLLSQSANIVANQNTYALPTGTSTLNYSVPQLRKLLRVEVKYSSSQPSAYKWTPINTNDMTKSLDYYSTYRPQNQMAFTIENNSVVIYPTPTANVTSGIKIRYEPTEIDLTYTDTETAIDLPWKMHDSIKEYIKYKIYDQQQRKSDAAWQFATYQERIRTYMEQLCSRYDQPIVQQTGVFSELMY